MIPLSTLLIHLTHGVSVLGVLPLVPFLESTTLAVFAAALPIGYLADRRGRFPLKPAFVTVFSLGAFGFYAAQVSRTQLVEPTVNLLVLLLAVRLLSPKGGRDYLQIFALIVFALAATSLLTLEPAFFAYLILVVTGIIMGLVLLSFHTRHPGMTVTGPQLRLILGVALSLPVCSLTLMVFFFLILPRTNMPLWHLLHRPASAAGLGERVLPGAFGGGSEADEAVFRVQTPELGVQDLYWRGIVLDRVEGHAWSRGDPPRHREMVRGGRTLEQEFFLEPRQDGLLPLLDPPQEVAGGGGDRSEDHVFRSRRTERRLSYQGFSRLGGTLAVGAGFDRQRYLQLPGKISSPVVALGRELAAEGGTERERIARLERWFLERRLTYDREQGRSPDPVGEFLFGNRRGDCEHFASAFALLLRLSGVPSRLVGGYYGGRYNALGGYYLVTESAAHVWVEALSEEGEWLRFDPTTLAWGGISAGERLRPLGPGGRLLDGLDYYWTRMVITYDLSRQLKLVSRAGSQVRRWGEGVDTAPALPWMATISGALLMGAFLRRRGSREERLLKAFLRRVRRSGSKDLPSSLGLQEMAERVQGRAGREFARRYGEAIFRDRRLTAEEYRHLRRLLSRVGRE